MVFLATMQTVELPKVGTSVEERYAMIDALPRPRSLRRSPIASFLAVAIIRLLKLAALGFLLNLSWSLKGFTTAPAFLQDHKASLFGLGFAALAILVVTVSQQQQKNLVANGEVAVGTITGRYYMNPYWYVNYEFEGKNGSRINNNAMDKTGKKFLNVGQQIFIYYSAANPRKAIAQCESWFEPSISGVEADPRF